MNTLVESGQFQTDPGVIDLGIGQPQLELLPRSLMRQASELLLSEPDMTPLNYGHGKGDGRFRLALAQFLEQGYGVPVSPDLLMATNGCSGALHLIAHKLAQPGDTVLVEEPTYFLAHKIFSDRGLKLVGVPMKEDGVCLESLEAAVARHRPKFFYTIPVYQNPSGITLSQSKRAALVELARTRNFLIVADEVYQLLGYGQPPPPPMAAWLESDVVFSVGSFSKILAPGLRLGWIQSSPRHLDNLLDCGLLRSGGGLNHFVGCLVRHVLSEGLQARFLADLRAIYAGRLEAMDRALTELGPLVSYRKPEGGYFFWVRLPEQFDPTASEAQAREIGVGYRTGDRFSSEGKLGNYVRLCFARYEEPELTNGVARLGELIQTAGV